MPVLRFLTVFALLGTLAGCQSGLDVEGAFAVSEVTRRVRDPLPSPRQPILPVAAAVKPTTTARPVVADAGGSASVTRRLSLRESIATALENSDAVRTLDRGFVRSADVTSYDPSTLLHEVIAEEAVFDPRFAAGVSGSRFNSPPGSPEIAQVTDYLHRDEFDVFAEVSKLWPLGTETSLSYQPPKAYLFQQSRTTPLLNPGWGSALVLDVRQPLLRGAGAEVNEAPIRIAQLRHDQSSWKFKDALIDQVRSIEESYWHLQAARAALQAYDKALPPLDEAVHLQQMRQESEMVTAAEVARVRLQRNEFRQHRIRAAAQVQQREYALRGLMGVPLTDGTRLEPVDTAEARPAEFDLSTLVSTAIDSRPDTLQRRLDVLIRSIELDVATNGVKPRLDLQVLHRTSGIDDSVDQSVGRMLEFGHTDWSAGLVFSIPLRNRAAKARANAMELQLVKSQTLLDQHVQNVAVEIAALVSDIQATQREYESARRRIADSRQWVEIARTRFITPPTAGEARNWLIVALDDYQLALRARVDARITTSQLLARYNTLLARLEQAQGTLLHKHRIDWSEDPLHEIVEHRDEWFGAELDEPRHVEARVRSQPTVWGWSGP